MLLLLLALLLVSGCVAGQTASAKRRQLAEQKKSAIRLQHEFIMLATHDASAGTRLLRCVALRWRWRCVGVGVALRWRILLDCFLFPRPACAGALVVPLERGDV